MPSVNQNLRGQAPVSVIVPCFCCAKTIGRAIESILLQTCMPTEVIFVDDASSDETLDLLCALEEKHPSLIRVLSLPVNVGAASARNRGWNAATQPYVAFLDADDSWRMDKIQVQYEFMRKHPEIVLCGHSLGISENDALKYTEKEAECSYRMLHANRMLLINEFSTPSVMLKRDIKFRFEEGQRYAEDAYLWQQIAFSGAKVAKLDKRLALIHKPVYGAGGLSAKLWKMEQGELSNLFAHYRNQRIGVTFLAVAVSFSLLKFFKRVLHTRFRNSRRVKS